MLNGSLRPIFYVTSVTSLLSDFIDLCTMKNKLAVWSKKYWITALGVITGGIAGYIYYSKVGCSSGNCAITSDPLNMTIYGMAMGGLFMNIISGYLSKTKQ